MRFSRFFVLKTKGMIMAFILLLSINSDAAIATQLKIISPSQTLSAGVCSQMATVQTRDSKGQPVPQTTAKTVSLSGNNFNFFSDSFCALKITSVKIVAGTSTANFYFKSTVAGSRNITASSSGLFSARQTETIQPGPAAKLRFKSQPSNTVINTAIVPSVEVAIADNYNNTVTTATHTLSIDWGNNPTQANLLGTKILSPTGGVALFANLIVDRVGTGYKLLASASGLTGATSTAFDISSPPNPLNLRPLPIPLYGVTVDAIDHLSATLQSLDLLAKMPTTRVVFDEWVPATDYQNAVTQINPISYVMGEILDSSAVKQYSVSAYRNRVTEYLDTLGDKVDLWEIGNEINGEWLGDTASVVAKMTGAYDLIKVRGGKTVLTLYYNEDCWSKAANEMFTWANANIPADMKQNLDFVLVSYYEEDCNYLRPDWPTVFQKLSTMFPNSKIGFGEIGTTTQDKADYINRYYSLQINQPNYIGGYFWWYFKQDMVPTTNPLWEVLNNAIQ